MSGGGRAQKVVRAFVLSWKKPFWNLFLFFDKLQESMQREMTALKNTHTDYSAIRSQPTHMPQAHQKLKKKDIICIHLYKYICGCMYIYLVRVWGWWWRWVLPSVQKTTDKSSKLQMKLKWFCFFRFHFNHQKKKKSSEINHRMSWKKVILLKSQILRCYMF